MTATKIYNALVISTAVLLCVHSEPLCLRGDFDSQLQLILRQEMLSKEEAADVLSQVLSDVLPTLNQRWQGYKVSPFGSLYSGLGTKSSDVDIDIRLPNFNTSAGLHVLRETKKLFKKQPELYSSLRYRYYAPLNVSVIAFTHNPSQRVVQIKFDAGDICVANSELMRYYYNLDERFLSLGGFLKYLSKIHGLTKAGKRSLRNYPVYLLVIFYLQQKNMAPPGHVLQRNSKSHVTSDGWDVGFNELPFRSENTESLHQLLGGFFKYYSQFDFEHNIVSPFTGRPISKNAFKDVDNFPKEYTLNNNKQAKQLEVRDFWNKKSTDICIQDIFVHNENSAERLSQKLVTKFKYLMKSFATMFEDLPSDSVLAAILNLDQHNEIAISHDCESS